MSGQAITELAALLLWLKSNRKSWLENDGDSYLEQHIRDRIAELRHEPKIDLLTFPGRWLKALADIEKTLSNLRHEIVAKHRAPPEMERVAGNIQPLVPNPRSWQKRKRSPDCICSDPDPHFCPPCLGEAGFYACDPERYPKT